MKHYDYLVVGSGLYGATFAHFAKKAGKTCLVIDKRSNIGGNLYCENIEGINVHKYGPHIFHTSNKNVWDFVNSIVPFNRFTYSPLANYRGNLYNLPFNMNTFHQMWGVLKPEQAQTIINEQKTEASFILKGVKPQNLEDQALMLIGKEIFEKLIKEYTEKQWGRKCTELPAFIIKRIPVRFTFDNNYFDDLYQGIPIGGYNKLIEGLLKGIEIKLKVDFFGDVTYWYSIADRIVYTGRLDEFYDCCYGKLKYRTVHFEQEIFDMANYQGNSVVNYIDSNIPYTRVIEHKHFEMFGPEVYKCPVSVISKEFPTEWNEGREPFYPIEDKINNVLAEKYRSRASMEKRVLFGGRLAEYRYYDMAPIIEKILSIKSF